ncbi:hypothetical protein HZC21_01850 [Candidatus Peregrinibacteria bacterium]|nr:hypothetical protein [Candidatus Peregrinibacteria bacterium]MBI5732367.1 hypothetical protein [Candidatus Jorgensenbacteria bacterium]
MIVGKLTLAHGDSRRRIEEFNSKEYGFSVQSFVVGGEEEPLGNHFHTEKDETFLILEGEGEVASVRVAYDDQREDWIPVGEVERTTVKSGSVIKIPAFTAHAFTLRHWSKFICFSSKAFDKEKKDIIPFKII